MAVRSRREWTKVRDAYIAGEGSYTDLAKRFGIRPKTLMARAQKERWGKLRKAATEKGKEKAVEKAAESLASVKALRLELAASMLRHAKRSLEEVELYDPEGLAHLARAVNGAIPADFIADLDGEPGAGGSADVEIIIRRKRNGEA